MTTGALLWVVFLTLTLATLTVVVALRTRTTPAALKANDPAEMIVVDARLVAEHLGEAIRIQTVATGDGNPPEPSTLDTLQAWLARTYPRVHTLPCQRFNQHALLFTWTGQNTSLAPVLFYAHQDVVPADPNTESEWTHPPFSGAVVDGYVWGRGALDMKDQLVALMEAAETLLARGWQPERTIYLALGFDEEVGGLSGAGAVAAHLKSQGVRLAALLDEGGFILRNVVPGVKVPAALIATGEKGYLTVRLAVTRPTGHSSSPPRHTAIGVLAQAITRLESHPMPAHPERVAAMILGLGSAAPYGLRLIFSNLWLFSGIVKPMLSARPQTDASMRTTTAITMVAGGIKDNVLPCEASALANFRLQPGDSIPGVLDHIRRVIADERVRVELIAGKGWEAPPVSPATDPAFRALAGSIRQVFGPIPATPYLMPGATDSRHFSELCKNIYRFAPVRLESEDLTRVHGINERIGVENLAEMTRFFGLIFTTWGSARWQASNQALPEEKHTI